MQKRPPACKAMSFIDNGFSLLETMLVIALSSILSIALVNVLISIKQSYRYLLALAEIQQHARIALHYLQHDIRIAGAVPCGQLAKPFSFSPVVGYSGNAGVWQPDVSLLKVKHLVKDSDIINLQGVNSHIYYLQNISEHRKKLYVSSKFFKQGQRIYIGDCHLGQLVTIDKMIDPHTFVIKNKLKTHYTAGAMLALWRNLTYYIAKTRYKNKQGKLIKALYRKVQNRTHELTPGIERMKIRYGIVGKKGIVAYYDAASLTADHRWAKVKSVHISLLLASRENILPHPQKLTFNRKSFKANDLRLYKQWQSYIYIRNHQ